MKKAAKHKAPTQSALTSQSGKWLFWLSLALLAFPVAFRQVSVSDAWWHVAIGKWLVHHRSLPDLSQFYFTPYDSGWLAGELRWTWLGDIVLYGFYAAGGSVGLQILSLLLLTGGLFFLAIIPPKPRSPWVLLIFAAVVFGTYHLQLIRNSAFSLFLYPVVLWLGLRKSGPPSLREYLILIGVLALWSCLHGSCTLGWVTGTVLFLTRALQRSADEPFFVILRRLGICSLALFTALLAIALGRPDALHFVTLPLRHAVALPSSSIQKSPPAAQKKNSSPEETSPSVPSKPSSLISVKTWLNNSVWKQDPSAPWSNDFWSPFDFPMKPLITVPLALIVAALIVLLAFRNVGWGLTLAWLGATFLALGYVRMLGYASLASAAVLLASFGRLTLPSTWRTPLNVTGWVLVALTACFLWGKMLSGKMADLLGEGQHVTAFGHTPNFDDTALQWVKTELPDAKVFTTIDSGSAALLAWDFEKPVFMDGFFAPHTREVLEDYSAARRTDNIAMLHEKYGITAAIIPNTAQSWREVFFFAPGWRPIALGIGSTVFLHENSAATSTMPAILYPASDLRKTSDLFVHHTTITAFSVLGHSQKLSGGFPINAWMAIRPGFFDESRRIAEDLAKRNSK